MKLQAAVYGMLTSGTSMRDIAKWLSMNMRGHDDGDKLEAFYAIIKHLLLTDKERIENEYNQ